MKNHFKVLSILAIFMIGILAGCGGGGSSSAGQSGSNDEVVTLEVWDWYEDDTARGEEQARLLKEYEENNPNVKFERTYIPNADLKTKILQGVAGGELPDIMVIDNPDHQSFAAAGALADITTKVEEWGQGDKYFEGAWNSTMYEGKNYGVPNNSNALALYYNKEMFKEAGIEGPPETWEELRTAAEKLTTEDRYGFAMSAVNSEEGTFQYLPFLWQAGADLDTFGSPEAISSMEFVKSLVEEGLMSENVINWTQQDVNTQFQTGKAAMMINGPWQFPTLRNDSPDLDWGVALMPEKEQSASILGGENWAISSTSEHKDIAWDFIKFTQQPEVLGASKEAAGQLPSRKDVATDPQYEWNKDEKMSVFVQQLETAKPRAYGTNYPEISSIVQEAIQSSLTGQNVEEVMKRSAEEIKPLLP